MDTVPGRKTLKKLVTKEYEHPLDRAALYALRATPGIRA